MVSLELEARVDNLLATAQAETADIDLFAPILEREECSICMIPLPFLPKETRFMHCCGKNICCGCTTKKTITDIKKGVPESKRKCAFCCQLEPSSGPQRIKALKRLMKRNNPVAFNIMAIKHKNGDGVLQSDTKSLEMYIRAAELGYAEAYAVIGSFFRKPDVDVEDKSLNSCSSKSIELMEVAAKKESVIAHEWLADYHAINENTHECIQHLLVAASAGYQPAMDALMVAYKDKLLSKEDLTQTLRTFQTSSNEMKSKDRDDNRGLMREFGM